MLSFICIIGFTEAKFSRSKQKPVIELQEYWHCPNGCGKKYSLKGNLSVHLKYQCGVPKQFQCSVCGKEFTLKAHWKTHMGLVHKLIFSD